MTVPDLSNLIPLKYKTYVAAISGILTLVVPWILQAATSLPEPWPQVVGLVIFILGLFGVYHAPYVPTGGVVVPQAVAETVHRSLPPAPGEYKNPWRA